MGAQASQVQGSHRPRAQMDSTLDRCRLPCRGPGGGGVKQGLTPGEPGTARCTHHRSDECLIKLRVAQNTLLPQMAPDREKRSYPTITRQEIRQGWTFEMKTGQSTPRRGRVASRALRTVR